MLVLRRERTRSSEAGSCHFLESKTGLWVEGALRPGPSVQMCRDVIISAVTEEEILKLCAHPPWSDPWRSGLFQ